MVSFAVIQLRGLKVWVSEGTWAVTRVYPSIDQLESDFRELTKSHTYSHLHKGIFKIHFVFDNSLEKALILFVSFHY